jgi:hypothetical protein
MKELFSKLEKLNDRMESGAKLCQAFCLQEEQAVDQMPTLIDLIVEEKLPAEEEAFYEANYPEALVNLLCEDECDDT